MPGSHRHPLARRSILDRREGGKQSKSGVEWFPRPVYPWKRPGWWRTGGEAALDPLGRSPTLARLEAALFASDEPLALRRLAAAAGVDSLNEVRELLVRLRASYDADGSAFQIEELAGGYQLLTRPEFHPWLARLRKGVAETKLSGPAREALTIVAYRQPVTRADLESIRGVQSGEVLRQLMERGLVRIAGRDTTLGRPVLYATTKKFLQLYGLKNLRDLPPVPELAPRSE